MPKNLPSARLTSPPGTRRRLPSTQHDGEREGTIGDTAGRGLAAAAGIGLSLTQHRALCAFVRPTSSKSSTVYGCPLPPILSQPSMQKRRGNVQRPLPVGWRTRTWTTFSQGIMRALPSAQRVRALPQRPLAFTSVTNWSLPLLVSAPDIAARCQAAATHSSWRLTACLTVKFTT